MEKGLDSSYMILKTLKNSGDLHYSEIITLASIKVGSSTKVEKTLSRCLKLGFVRKIGRGLYGITRKGEKVIEALETPQ